MRNPANKMLVAAAILILGTVGISAHAQDQPPAQGQPDPGVARVSFIRGDVFMQRGDSGDTSAATLNTPLVSGDKISTGDGSRAELQLDFANILRLDERAQATLATLGQNRIQVQVAQGLANYSMLSGSETEVEIDTPNVAVRPLKQGRYRIQIDPSGDTYVTVREGQAEVSTPQGSTTVGKGDLITIRGAGDDTAYQVTNAPSSDAWDSWNRDRDNTISDAESYRHTSRYYTGAGDLDSYGSWGEVPDYGPVWIPRVDAGWAPYRAGRWVWEPYYGWTWVSYEPWGWAPYHYGRWFLYDGSWAWWPGPVYGPFRPVWAPAYVSFFGFGGGFGASFSFGFGGFGSIGWLPIGPCDYFHPWYGGFRDRFTVVNVNNFYSNHEGFAPLHSGDRFSNLRNVGENERLRQGLSTVNAERFGRGAIDPRPVSAGDFRNGRAMTGNLPVVPTHESLRTSDRNVSPTAFNGRNSNAHFYTRNAPSSRPQSFSAQTSQLRQAMQRDGHFQVPNGGANSNSGNPNRPFGGSGGRGFEAQQPNQNRGQVQDGFRRFSDRPNVPTANSQPYNSGNGGRGFEAQQPSQNRGQVPDGFRRFSDSPRAGAPPANPGTAGNSYRPPFSSYREPLNLNRPIVRERSYSAPAYNGPREGGANAPPSPAYRNAPNGNFRSAPSAPSYRSAPRAENRGGAAPSYRGNSGGGNYSGGGGRGGAPSHGGGSSGDRGGSGGSSSGRSRR